MVAGGRTQWPARSTRRAPSRPSATAATRRAPGGRARRALSVAPRCCCCRPLLCRIEYVEEQRQSSARRKSSSLLGGSAHTARTQRAPSRQHMGHGQRGVQASRQRQQSGHGCRHAQWRHSGARGARPVGALHGRRHSCAPSASPSPLAVHAVLARVGRLRCHLAQYTQRELAGVLSGSAASSVDGHERAMYRKSDLRKSVSDSQILATYTWTLPISAIGLYGATASRAATR